MFGGSIYWGQEGDYCICGVFSDLVFHAFLKGKCVESFGEEFGSVAVGCISVIFANILSGNGQSECFNNVISKRV